MFAPVRICEILNEEHVEYVVIGGFAAVVHGSSLPTRDVDIVPSRHIENLDRLARALTRMHAALRISDGSVPVKIDREFLVNMSVIVNLVTDFGEINLTFMTPGHAGAYEGWRTDATLQSIGQLVTVVVGSLEDIIDSKQAANRPKGLRVLPYLETLREEVQRRNQTE